MLCGDLINKYFFQHEFRYLFSEFLEIILMPNSLLEISKYHSGKIFYLKYAMTMMPDLSKMS
jgi:hypothetical protein